MASSKKVFVRALAEFLAGQIQAEMSIRLEMAGRGSPSLFPDAKRWAALREATPLFGYPSVDDAEKQLAAWLGVGP